MWKRKLAAGLVRGRIWVLAALAVVSGVAGYYAQQVEFDQSIEIWFLENDPELETYHAFLDRFVADEVGVIALFADDVFAPEALAAIARLTAAAEEAPHAHRVTSLTDVRVARAVGDAIEIAELVDELPTTPAESDEIRRRAMANSMLAGSIVSKDSRATAVVVEMDEGGNSFDGKVEFAGALRAAADLERERGFEIELAGSPVFDDEFYRANLRDASTLGNATLALILIITYALYRRISATIVPMVVVGLAVLWTFGAMGFVGLKSNTTSVILVAVGMAVGVADTIHILSDYYQQLMEGAEPEEAVEESVASLLTPCLFTSLTTAAGFLSLLVSDLRPLREMGMLAAFGVVCAFIATFTFVPAVLRMAKPPSPEFIDRQRSGPISRLLRVLGRPSLSASRAVLAFSVPLVLGSLWAISQLEVGSNPMNYFLEDNPVRVAMEKVDDRLGGSASIEFFVHSDDQGLKKPEHLSQLDDFERWLTTQPGVTSALSAVDALKDMNRVFQGGGAEHEVVPSDAALVAQYFLLMEGEEDFDSMLQSDYAVGRISARVKLKEATTFSEVAVPRMEERIEREFSGDIRLEATGFIKLMYKMEEYLVASQVRSMLLAFVVITTMLYTLLHSVRLTLFSMIPNFVPIVVGLGFMQVAGIALDPGTVMIGCIALGLVVDDTVHYLVRLRRRVQEGHTLEDAIDGAMQETGRPIIVTSIALAAGFGVNALGSFAPNIYFGIISSLVILLAVVADLVMLPAALLVVRPNLGSVRLKAAES